MATLSSEAFYKPEETYNMRVNMGKSIGESLKGVSEAVTSAGQYLTDKANKKQLIDELNSTWSDSIQYNDQFMSMTPDKLAEKVFAIKTLDQKAKAIKQNIGGDVSLPSPIMVAMHLPSIAQLPLAEGTYDNIAKNLQDEKDKKLTATQLNIFNQSAKENAEPSTIASAINSTTNTKMMPGVKEAFDSLKKQRAREWIGEKARLLNLQRQHDGKKPIERKLGDIIKPSTRNHYLAIAKTAYDFAMKRGKLKESPLKTYEKEKETSRDRVWTVDEKKKIFEVLSERKSHLYWPVYFSAMNPIRRGDLVSLNRENFYFNQFNPSKSYIHFIPQKTGRYKPREAQLICIDKPLLDYFQSLPADSPLLFPRFDVAGQWYPLGCFKREWHAVLKAAKVTGMTWHDLKHCAITWMLDNGFSELDLKNLGIQYSAEMIARYYHKDADKARGAWDRIQEKSGAVPPSCATLAQKTA